MSDLTNDEETVMNEIWRRERLMLPMPTTRQLSNVLDFTTTDSAKTTLRQLEVKGYVHVDWTGHAKITLLIKEDAA